MTEERLGDKIPQIRKWVMANEMTTQQTDLYVCQKKTNTKLPSNFQIENDIHSR